MGLEQFADLLFEFVDLCVFVLLLSDTLGQLLVLLDHALFNTGDGLAQLLELHLLGLTELRDLLGFGLTGFSCHLLSKEMLRCRLFFAVFNKTAGVLFGRGLDRLE